MRRSRWMRLGILVAALSIAATVACGWRRRLRRWDWALKTDDFVIGVSNTLAATAGASR